MKARCGQVALYLALVLVGICILAVMNVGAFLAVRAKNRAMNAGDAAALAVAKHQGELLNRIGVLNVEHLEAALKDDVERCEAIEDEQARLCFLEPLKGISIGNEVARENGAERSDAMRDILKRHADDVRTLYIPNPESYPEPWTGAWEKYAQRIEHEISGDFHAGPDNIDFIDAQGGHLLLDPQFYHAIAGKSWCWFKFNAPGVLDSYSSFKSWGPLPTADDAARRDRCVNSEIYSLHLLRRTGSAVDLFGKDAIMRLTGASESEIDNSTQITNQLSRWYCYSSSLWRNWWEINPDGPWNFPVVGSVRREYDVRGCAAVCRIRQTMPILFSEKDKRSVEWAAAAKPFGTVEGLTGELEDVTAFSRLVTSAFTDVRLVPLDAVGGRDLMTADPDWMWHVREHLRLYLQNGPSANNGCYFCRQLVSWERDSVRSQGREWLQSHGNDCVRPVEGGSSWGGTPHGH